MQPHYRQFRCACAGNAVSSARAVRGMIHQYVYCAMVCAGDTFNALAYTFIHGYKNTRAWGLDPPPHTTAFPNTLKAFFVNTSVKA